MSRKRIMYNTRKNVKAWQPICFAALFALAVFGLILIGHLLYTGVEAIIKGFGDAVAATFTPPVVMITLGIALAIFIVLALIRHTQQTYKRGRQSGADQTRVSMGKTVKALEAKNAGLLEENRRLSNQLTVASFMREEGNQEDPQDFDEVMRDLAGE